MITFRCESKWMIRASSKSLQNSYDIEEAIGSHKAIANDSLRGACTSCSERSQCHSSLSQIMLRRPMIRKQRIARQSKRIITEFMSQAWTNSKSSKTNHIEKHSEIKTFCCLIALPSPMNQWKKLAMRNSRMCKMRLPNKNTKTEQYQSFDQWCSSSAIDCVTRLESTAAVIQRIDRWPREPYDNKYSICDGTAKFSTFEMTARCMDALISYMW